MSSPTRTLIPLWSFQLRPISIIALVGPTFGGLVALRRLADSTKSPSSNCSRDLLPIMYGLATSTDDNAPRSYKYHLDFRSNGNRGILSIPKIEFGCTHKNWLLHGQHVSSHKDFSDNLLTQNQLNAVTRNIIFKNKED